MNREGTVISSRTQPDKPAVVWIRRARSDHNASFRLRALRPSQILEQRARTAIARQSEERLIDRADICIFQKAYGVTDLALARRLRQQGKRVILDVCDYEWLPTSRTERSGSRAADLEAFLPFTDLVTVSTPALMHQLPPGVRTEVVPDSLEKLDPAPPRLIDRVRAVRHRASRRVRLLWFGNVGKRRLGFGLCNLESRLGVLNRANAATPLSLTVVTSARADTADLRSRAQFPVHVYDWSERRVQTLAAVQDACVLPIEKNDFTRCKTANRLIHAVRLGLPVIADGIPSYEEFRPNVFLDDWERGLATYAREPERRVRDARNAAAFAESTYSDARIGDAWMNAFRRCLDGATS